MFIDRVTLKITGVHGPDQFDEVQKLAGNLYLKGTDSCLFADMSRERADLVAAEINSTPGLHAEFMRWV